MKNRKERLLEQIDKNSNDAIEEAPYLASYIRKEVKIEKAKINKLINNNKEKIETKNEIVENQVDLKLKKFIENIEVLEEEKKEISQQITETYKKAKLVGFDIRTMKEIVKLRKIEVDERFERKQLLETYCEQLELF